MSTEHMVLEAEIDNLYTQIDFDTLDRQASILYLLCGTDCDDEDFYAYMAIQPSRYREFLLKQSLNDPFTPTDYGVVIESGLGVLPPKELQEDMKQNYGFDPKYQEEIETFLLG